MRRKILHWLVLAYAVSVSIDLASALNVSLPTSAPGDCRFLSPTLVPFSIEQDRWPEWVGVQSRNKFTHNALSNYAALTGQAPSIRVGANAEDRTVWSSDVAVVESSFPPPTSVMPYPQAANVTVGDTYYTLSQFLPAGTRMTWGINLGADNITNAVNMAKTIVAAFSSDAVQSSGVVLERIEVGNEADFYKNNGLRPSDCGRDDRVTLQGASFAEQEFTPRQLFDLGILDSAPGKTISVISQHHYSAALCDGGDLPLTSFMSKSAIRGNLTILEADISATQAQGLDYILGETNSAACHGTAGVSNTAGAALWAIDYTLQAATLGIKQAYFHGGFQPVTLNNSIVDGSPLNPPSPPHIQPIYYAGLVINTLIGNTTSSQIVELAVDDPNVSGYAAFEHGTLVRAVFVNLHAWLLSGTGVRPSVHIDLDFAGAAPATATARRLVIGHADDTEGVTWAGQSYETADALPSGSLMVERVSLSDGIDLRATEAVFLSF